jgi:very-short-patch-repair endonuclease
VSLAQLSDVGLSKALVNKWLARGRLHRVHRGVYSIAPTALLSGLGHYMAAVLAAGPGAALSHRSAAAILELRGTDRSKIEVITAREHTRLIEGVQVHRSRTLTRADIEPVNGIPCTTVARTLLDLAAVVSPRALERAIEQGEIQQRLDLYALQGQIKRNRGTVGGKRLAAALAYYVGQAPTESELEELLHAHLRAADLPAPERQAHIDPGDGEPPLRVDFAWRAQRVVVETDGGRYHRTRRAFEADRRRDQRLTLAGWRVIRITWRQLVEEPERVIALLTQLLRPA